MGGIGFSRAGRSAPARSLLRAALVPAVVGWAALVLSHPPAQAQLSPNCKRNGKPDCCALTPVAGATHAQQTVDKLTFADHTVYEVLRNETSCKNIAAMVRTCNASITTAGQPKPLPAFYRGTAYEGGYRHEYVGRGLHLIYTYLD